MAKLESLISNFIDKEDLFGGRTLVILAIIFLILCTDILDNIIDDDNYWVWGILIILLIFNFNEE
ncbi:MAG: hypothetical protein R3Y64_01195 [Peptostreptococcaceae bacterium]